MGYRYAIAATLVVIGVAAMAIACGRATEPRYDAQAWSMQPEINGNDLLFSDGSSVNVHVFDASGRCYELEYGGVGFTTSEPKPGKPDPSTVDLTVVVHGVIDCSNAP